MHTQKFFLLLTMLAPLLCAAQTPSKQMMVIHEDQVLPSKVMEYEQAAMGLKKVLDEQGSESISYMAVALNDFRYLYVSPIESYADLDADPFADLTEKVGKEAMAKVWDAFDGCYNTHWDYIVTLNNELSHDPEGISMDEKAFRNFTYYYVHPNMESEAWEVAKAWKALYEKKGVKTGYRLYTGGMGLHSPLFLTVRQAKDEADFRATIDAEFKALGEEGQALNKRTLDLCQRIVEVNGQMRADLSYMPSK